MKLTRKNVERAAKESADKFQYSQDEALARLTAARLSVDRYKPIFSSTSGALAIQLRRMLDGRTHYWTVDTMQCHRSRLADVSVVCWGLAICGIESYNATIRGHRLYRPVVHDLRGVCIFRPEGVATLKAARKQFNEWQNNVNALELAFTQLEAEQTRLQNAIKRLAGEYT